MTVSSVRSNKIDVLLLGMVLSRHPFSFSTIKELKGDTPISFFAPIIIEKSLLESQEADEAKLSKFLFRGFFSGKSLFPSGDFVHRWDVDVWDVAEETLIVEAISDKELIFF